MNDDGLLHVESPKRRGKLIVDIDGTLCPIKVGDLEYKDLVPFEKVIARLREYREEGFSIVLHTSRNMKTYSSNVGLINKHTLPVLIAWLEKWSVPFDEIYIGKPWPGEEGFYVDDRAIRPDEFLTKSRQELEHIVEEGRKVLLGADL
jgi:capsule biosynthesis phosphatase